MMILLLFEVKKYLADPKNKLLLCLLIVVILFICVQTNNDLLIEKEKVLENDTYVYEQLLTDGREYEKEFPELMSHFEQALSALEKKLAYASEQKWQESLKQENLFIDNVVAIQEKTSLPYIETDLLKVKQENDYFLTYQIKPDNCLQGVSALYYVRLILSKCFSVYGYLFVLLLFYDLFSREKEKHTVKWLMTLPVPYKKVNQSKLMLALGLIGMLLVMLMGATFILGLILTKHVGSIAYPLAFKASSESVSGLSFIKYSAVSLVIFLLVSYLMLLILLSLTAIKMEPEKVLLLGILSLTILSQVTLFLTYQPFLWSLMFYINLHETMVATFEGAMFRQHLYIIGIFVLLLIVLTYWVLNDVRGKQTRAKGVRQG